MTLRLGGIHLYINTYYSYIFCMWNKIPILFCKVIQISLSHKKKKKKPMVMVGAAQSKMKNSMTYWHLGEKSKRSIPQLSFLDLLRL
ncbi:hypothetical protein Sjap_018504 [Stephania japonica]|uniref:Uncharacterized protein n=1 Tax=Stephania japonica TaxID=461633 RepID=A0AAP0I849_9MAGN